MSDVILILVIAAAFALTITAQLAILSGLVRRKRPWRALSGLLFPPLSLYWAHLEGMPLRALAWIVGAVIYVATLALALWRG